MMDKNVLKVKICMDDSYLKYSGSVNDNLTKVMILMIL